VDATKEYYKLYFKTLWKLIRTIGWREYIIALFCLVVGSTYYARTRGWEAMIEEALNFIAYTLAPLALVAFLFILDKIVQTPVKIHEDLKAELEKFSWVGVTVEPWNFPPDSGLGVGLHIYNGKSVVLEGAYVTIKSAFKDRVLWFNDHTHAAPFMPWALKDNQLLYKQMDIYAGQHCYIVIANWDRAGAYLDPYDEIGGKRERFSLEKGVEYYIIFTIFAMLNGFNLYPYITYNAIVYYDGSKVTIKPYADGNVVAIEEK
jgi:hypothetical protein